MKMSRMEIWLDPDPHEPNRFLVVHHERYDDGTSNRTIIGAHNSYGHADFWTTMYNCGARTLEAVKEGLKGGPKKNDQVDYLEQRHGVAIERPSNYEGGDDAGNV